MSWLKDLKRDLKRLGEPIYERAERLAAPGLAASYGLDSAPKPNAIKDISSSGIYLVTGKRLNAGELITLTRRKKKRPKTKTAQSSSSQCTRESRGRLRTVWGYRSFCLRAWIQSSGECWSGTSLFSKTPMKSRTCSTPYGLFSSCAACVIQGLRKRSFCWADNWTRIAQAH